MNYGFDVNSGREYSSWYNEHTTLISCRIKNAVFKQDSHSFSYAFSSTFPGLFKVKIKIFQDSNLP